MHLGGISYHFVHFVSIGLATPNHFDFLVRRLPFLTIILSILAVPTAPKKYFF
jgi:hypothetical protein